MKVTCILASAGKGKRLGLKKDKVFITLGKKPVLAHTLKALEACSFLDEIVLVVSRENIKKAKALCRKHKFKKVTSFVSGGKKRFNSVKNGLRETRDSDYILVHDGARPFIDKSLVKKVLDAAKKHGSAILGTPYKQTLKVIDKSSFIVDTPKRKLVWEAQTPQVFKKDLIFKAYKNKKAFPATDDASLVEKLGKKVKVVKGSYKNIKITTPEDLKLAKAFLK